MEVQNSFVFGAFLCSITPCVEVQQACTSTQLLKLLTFFTATVSHLILNTIRLGGMRAPGCSRRSVKGAPEPEQCMKLLYFVLLVPLIRDPCWLWRGISSTVSATWSLVGVAFTVVIWKAINRFNLEANLYFTDSKARAVLRFEA